MPDGYQSDNLRKWEFNNSLYQKHLELYLDLMYRHLASTGAGSVLDVGCGEGIVYRAMRERGYTGKWSGIDFSAQAIEFARKASPEAKWDQGSAFGLPFDSNSFDLVFCSQVLEHLPDPRVPLEECARVARDWLLLSVPYEPWFRTLQWIAIHLRLGGDPGHVNFWTPSRFRQFVAQSGRLERWDWTTVYQISLVGVSNAKRR